MKNRGHTTNDKRYDEHEDSEHKNAASGHDNKRTTHHKRSDIGEHEKTLYKIVKRWHYRDAPDGGYHEL